MLHLSHFLSRLKIGHLWLLTVIAGILAFSNTHPIRPNDFWWHMAVGQTIVQTRQIPSSDAYSYTQPGHPYPSYQVYWLMEIAFYGIFSLGGPALIVFANSMVIALAYTGISMICWSVSHDWRLSAFCTLFAVLLGIYNWNVRPQSISLLLGALCLAAIYTIRRNPSYRFLLVFPLIFISWVNSHGTFAIGLILLGIWNVEGARKVLKNIVNRQKPWIIRESLIPPIAMAISLFACLVNPTGTGIIPYLQSMFNNPVVQRLTPEWAPPTLATLEGSFFWVSLLLCIVILAFSTHRPGIFQMGCLIAFATLGIMTTRGIIWFGLITAPILADHLPAVIARIKLPPPKALVSKLSMTVNASLLFFLIFFVVITLPWFKQILPLPAKKAGLISAETPVNATRFLIDNHLPTNVFNNMDFGSYLIWTAQPDYKVFVDPRIDLYPVETWQDYLTISNASSGWDKLLEQYQVSTLMLNPIDQAALVASIIQSTGWSRVYEDHQAVIFVRKSLINTSFSNAGT
jgi:hypothetical protein